MELLNRLNEIGFERPRRAVAALALSLFVFFYLVIALLLGVNEQREWVPVFVALSAAYGVAFMGVAAEWFWGRWFAAGLGWSGLMIAIASIVMSGQWSPILGVYGGLHGLVVLMLAGKKMAERYDLQPAWRERYAMDEFGVDRLRKTITRASASLPSVILWALAPKEPGQGMVGVVLCVGVGALGVAGLHSVIRLRTWGVLALGAAGAALAALLIGASAGVLSPVSVMPAAYWAQTLRAGLGHGQLARHLFLSSSLRLAIALPLLLASVAPFVGPAVRFVRAQR